MLRETPFHARTAPLNQGQSWRRWAGHYVASVYELHHEREYHAIRNSAALLDISPLYKYLITGKDSVRLIDRVITRDVAAMKVGQVYYTPWCDSAGKVIDDGTVSRLGEDRLRLTSAEPSYRWLHENAVGLDVKIEDVSDTTAALALQGPLSRTILEKLCERELGSLKYFRVTEAKARGTPIAISRTGYTGDLGYEVWLDAKDALPVWDALIEVGAAYGITPAGMLALDMARIEAGLMLLDVDYVSAHKAHIEAQKSSPFELNLGWAVNLKKEFFVGRDALAAEKQRQQEWRFTGVTVDWDSLETLYAAVGLPPRLPGAAWRTSVPIYVDGVQVGYATSGSWSPFLKKYIALAHLQGPAGKTGEQVEMEVTVEHRRRKARARVTDLPFFNPERKRA
jgi:aminomethyltransferase